MAMDESTRKIIAELKIASPCPMLWKDMESTADDAVRFCGECKKNVYNVASMTGEETSLLMQRAQAAGGSACLQLYRRADGTIITDDCPVGLRRVRDFWRKVRSTAAAIGVMIVALPAFGQNNDKNGLSGGVKAEGAKDSMRTPAGLLGGAPCPINWHNEAMKNASIKKMSDQVDAMKRKAHSSQDTISVLRMRLAMARAGAKANLPYFSMEELENAVLEADRLPSKSPADRSAKVQLMKDLLTEQKSVFKTLSISNTEAIDSKLKALESEK